MWWQSNYQITEITTLLISYLKKLNNGVAYKRLGFLIEKYFEGNENLIHICHTHMTTGYANLIRF